MNNEILKRLDLLAAKLGVGAQHLWEVLIKQARVEGALDLGISLFLAALAAALIALAIHWTRKEHDFDMPEFEACAGAALCLIIAVCFAYDAATELINPEFFALSEVLRALK